MIWIHIFNFCIWIQLTIGQNSNCEFPKEWRYPKIQELAEVGQVYLEANIPNVTKIQWNSDAAAATLLNFKDLGNSNFGVEVLEDLSEATDCLNGLLLDDVEVIFDGSYFLTCSDGSTVASQIANRFTIEPSNNRPPKFNQNEFRLVNVSRTIPANIDYLFVYKETIQVQDNDIPLKDGPTVTVQDDLGLFSVELGQAFNDTSSFCDQRQVVTFPLKLMTSQPLPLDITDTYELTLTSVDSENNRDSAKLIIEFLKEDLLPPIFNQSYYETSLQDPHFTNSQVLDVDIHAQDGDESIGAPIKYDIPMDQSCSKVFEIDERNGQVSWIAPLEESCLINDNIYLNIEACQEDNADRCSRTVLIIRVLGNDNAPRFNLTIYQAKQLSLSVGPGHELELEGNVKIEATVDDIFNTKVVLYQLVNGQGFFELTNEQSCEIKTSTDFEMENLDQDQTSFALVIKAYIQGDSSKETFATLNIPYQVDRLPPKFISNQTFDYYIANPEFSGSETTLFKIEAIDGDEDIDAEILYELLDDNPLPEVFQVEQKSGNIQWVQDIPKGVIKQEKVDFTIMAYQESKKSKNATQKITITFPGDEKDPKFTQDIYNSKLDFNGNLDFNQVQAEDQDKYLNESLTYSIEGSDMFEIDAESGIISKTSKFNANELSVNGLILYLKATQVDSDEKYGTSLMNISYQFNAQEPQWNEDNAVIILNLNETQQEAIVTQDRFKATDTDFGIKVQYELVNDLQGRYALENVNDFIKVKLVQRPDEDTTDLLEIKAKEVNVIPERESKLLIAINVHLEVATTTQPTTSTSTTTTDPSTTSSSSTEPSTSSSSSTNPSTTSSTSTEPSTTSSSTTDPSSTSSSSTEPSTSSSSSTDPSTTSSTSTDPSTTSLSSTDSSSTSTDPSSSTSPSTTTPGPLGDCRLDFEHYLYSFKIQEGQQDAEVIECGNVTTIFKGDDCPTEDEYDHGFNIDMLSPDLFKDFISLNQTTGQFMCKSIWTETEEDYPEFITLTIQDKINQYQAWAMVLFKIEKANNHQPAFSNQTYEIIGFPDFIYLESPITIPITQFQGQDNDKDSKLMYLLNANGFNIDTESGQVFYANDKYLSEEVNGTVAISDGLYQVEKSVSFVPLKQDNVIALKLIGQCSMQDLNHRFPGHEFRLLKNVNQTDIYVYVSIRKLANFKDDQPLKNTFLNKKQAQELFENWDDIQVTDDISYETITSNENSAFKPVAIVFIVAFFLLIFSMLGFYFYIRKLKKNKEHQEQLKEDRFSGTLARQIHMNNNQQEKQDMNDDAPDIKSNTNGVGGRTISFNENAEVVTNFDKDQLDSEPDSDEENATSL